MPLILLKETKKEILKDKKPKSVVFVFIMSTKSKNSKDYFFLLKNESKNLWAGGTSVDAFQNNGKTNLRIKKKERNLKR